MKWRVYHKEEYGLVMLEYEYGSMAYTPEEARSKADEIEEMIKSGEVNDMLIEQHGTGLDKQLYDIGMSIAESLRVAADKLEDEPENGGESDAS